MKTFLTIIFTILVTFGQKTLRKDIIFSTENIENLKFEKVKDYIFTFPDGDSLKNQYEVYNLPFKINNHTISILCTDSNGNWYVYYLCTSESDVVASTQRIDITPKWESPVENEGNYSNKYFTISKDFIVTIVTEESVNRVIKKYTKKYRINNSGEFYEVK